jgi:hypothetical protein
MGTHKLKPKYHWQIQLYLMGVHVLEVVGRQKEYDAYNIACLLGACLKFILGLSLAFGVRFWLSLLYYFRELGLSGKTSNQ